MIPTQQHEFDALVEHAKLAGQAREIVHAIQQLRRDRGLEITDRIDLALGGDPMLLDAAREQLAAIDAALQRPGVFGQDARAFLGGQKPQRKSAAPAVKPAPTEANNTRSPFFSLPSWRAVSMARGMVPAVVLP